MHSFFLKKWLGPYQHRSVWVLLGMGFYCGMPLLLLSRTLSFWMISSGESRSLAGLITFASIPYTFKVLWAPIVNHVRLGFLARWFGHRRSWMLVAQGLFVVVLSVMSFYDPIHHFWLFVVCCAVGCFASALMAIVMFAYQAARLKRHLYGAGEATGIMGFRFAILTTGAGCYYLAEIMTWGQVYGVMALLAFSGLFFTMLIKEPLDPKEAPLENHLDTLKNPPSSSLGKWFRKEVTMPLYHFIQSHKNWGTILLLMFLCRMGDHLIASMVDGFFWDVGFSKQDIADAKKIFGMAATIFGGFVGGALLHRFSLIQVLLWSIFMHGLATMGFVVIAHQGYDMTALYLIVAAENITGGIRLTAFFSYQLSLCHPQFAAIQLSLMASLNDLSRVFFGTFSGILSQYLGWSWFFTLASFASLPAVVLAALLQKNVASLNKTLPKKIF